MKMYATYLSEITQMEAEPGLSEKFDFIKQYAQRDYEGGFQAANEKYHVVRKQLSAVFQERLNLNAEDSDRLFRSYSEHFSDQYDIQKASEDFFKIEERIQECIEADEVAKNAYDGLRNGFARSVNAPFEFRGDVDVETAAIEQAVNFQKILAERLKIFHNITYARADTMVDQFTELQHLNARQLVQARLHDGM